MDHALTRWQRFRIALAAAAPAVVLAVFGFRELLVGAADGFPKCNFRAATGYLCPGCGNTRAVRAMLYGDIVTAVQYNITMPIVAVLLLLLYVELVRRNLGSRHYRTVPRNVVFYGVLIVGVYVYYLLRNFYPMLSPLT